MATLYWCAVSVQIRTRFAGAQAAAGQPEVVAAALQQQHVREAVLLHQQHRLDAAPGALLRVPAATAIATQCCERHAHWGNTKLE